jgi:hypothetical protein
MTPKRFKEAQVRLEKPSSMSDEECGGLWIYRQEGYCISLWTCSFWERIKFLFHGHLWVYVLSGMTQPPIALDVKKTIFNKEEK